MVFCCFYCGAIFDKSVYLKNHLLKSIPCDFVCRGCGESQGDKNKYSRHIKKNCSPKEYTLEQVYKLPRYINRISQKPTTNDEMSDDDEDSKVEEIEPLTSSQLDIMFINQNEDIKLEESFDKSEVVKVKQFIDSQIDKMELNNEGDIISVVNDILYNMKDIPMSYSDYDEIMRLYKNKNKNKNMNKNKNKNKNVLEDDSIINNTNNIHSINIDHKIPNDSILNEKSNPLHIVVDVNFNLNINK